MAENFITPVVRLAFPHLFQKQGLEGSTPKYNVVALIEKGEDLKPYQVLLYKAAKDFHTKGNEALWKAMVNKCLRDGDEKAGIDGYAGYDGHHFFRAASTRRPQVVDGQLREVDEEDIYGGCYAKLSIHAYGYDKGGNKGVAFGLGNVQKVRDGERLGGGGGASATDEFVAIDGAQNVSPVADDDEVPF